MSHSSRIYVFLFMNIASGFLYWTINFSIVLVVACWEIHEVWLDQNTWLSPYAAFNTLFALLFIWLIVESLLISRKKNGRSFHITILACIFIFLSSTFYVQYEHWQFLRFSQNAVTMDEYWENRIIEYPRPPRDVLTPTIQSFHDFKHEIRCKDGLSLFNLTVQEKKELTRLYYEKNNWKLPKY